MPRPGAGDLNSLITIEQNALTKDAAGGMVDNWTPVADSWAKVRHVSGDEKPATSKGGGQTPWARTEITVRWLPGVTEQMRVLLDGRCYNIRHVNNYLARNEWLILTCDTGGNDGR